MNNHKYDGYFIKNIKIIYNPPNVHPKKRGNSLLQSFYLLLVSIRFSLPSFLRMQESEYI